MDDIISDTNERFVRALEEAVGPFFEEGYDVKRNEPLSFVAAAYDRDIDITMATRELGILDQDASIQQRIRDSADIIGFGVGPLGDDDGVVKRRFWESDLDAGVSVFQRMALEFARGSSVVH